MKHIQIITMFRTGLVKKIKPSISYFSRFSSSFIEQKVNVGDLKINYVQSGDGKNSILLMPGALGSAWTNFKPQIEKLPQLLPNHTIIAWDPPGYGQSIPPKREFNFDFFRNDAECARNLMNILGFPKFSILGWGNGGITGIILTANHPKSVDNLVIWGAGAYITESEFLTIEAIRDNKKLSEEIREPMVNLYGEELFSQLWSEWVDTTIAFYDHRHGDFCRKEVNRIIVPTLILHGKKDPIIAAEHVPYIRSRILGCRYYEFRDGKHDIHLQYAEEFNKVVSKFLLDEY